MSHYKELDIKEAWWHFCK